MKHHNNSLVNRYEKKFQLCQKEYCSNAKIRDTITVT